MEARFADIDCLLLQSWSEDDFVRMQENLIGHLLTQKRLKLPPTLFLATTESEMALISLSNVSGEVCICVPATVATESMMMAACVIWRICV